MYAKKRKAIYVLLLYITCVNIYILFYIFMSRDRYLDRNM